MSANHEPRTDPVLFEWRAANVGYAFTKSSLDALADGTEDRAGLTKRVHDEVKKHFIPSFGYLCQSGGALEIPNPTLEPTYLVGHLEESAVRVKINGLLATWVRTDLSPNLVLKCGAKLGLEEVGSMAEEERKPDKRWCYPQGGRWFNREIYRLQDWSSGSAVDWDLLVPGPTPDLTVPMIIAFEWECPHP